MALLARPPVPASMVVDLARIVGAANVSNLDVDRSAYAHDAWIRDRIETEGRAVESAPAAVVWPESPAEVSRVLQWANQVGVAVIPWGGGTGRCGGARPTHGGVVLDVKRMRAIRRLDDASLRCEVEAGMLGARLERQLRRQGFTLGHDVAGGTVGGWLARRSGGNFSSRYGKIEEMAFGLEVVTPGRVRRLFGGPRPFDFPDFNAMVMGSEGTLGVITAAELRIRPVPPSRQFAAYRFSNLDAGAEAVRCLMRARLRPAVIRLHDPVESWLLRQGGPGEGELWLERWLRQDDGGGLGVPAGRWGAGLIRSAARGALSTPSMVNRALEGLSSDVFLMMVFEGSAAGATAERRHAEAICLERGASRADSALTETWYERRFASNFAQARLLGSGLVVDQLDAVTTWDRVLPVYRSVRRSLAREALVMGHLSEARPEGCGIRFTFGLRAGRAGQAESTRERYDQLWRHALHAVHEAGAAIAFDQGIGELRRPLLEREHGIGGVRVLRALKMVFDPEDRMNPSKLLTPDTRPPVGRRGTDTGLPHQISRAVGERNLYVRGNRTIVRPPDERALAALLRVAGPRGVPLSSDQTGFRPRLGAVHLDMSRFEGVRRLSDSALFVEVEAGVVVSRLEQLLRSHQLTLGPVHPRAWNRSVGAGLSRNLLVRRGVAHGQLGNLCMGVRGLLADGTSIETRTVPASATGPMIERMLVGGHGRLGIITKATLRLVACPDQEFSLAYRFTRWEPAITAARRMLQRGVRPAAARLYADDDLGVILALDLVAPTAELRQAQVAIVASAVSASEGAAAEEGDALGGRFDVVVEVTQRWGAALHTLERLQKEAGPAWIDFLTPEGVTVVTRIDSREARQRAVQIAVELEGRVVAGSRSPSPIDAESYAVATGPNWKDLPVEEPESGPYLDLLNGLARTLDPGRVLSDRS